MSKYPYYIEVPFSTDVNTKEVVEWTTFEVKDKEDEQFVNYCYKSDKIIETEEFIKYG